MLGSTEIDLQKMRPDQVAIDTEASVISPGTELAILSGGESWAPLPYIPGYGSVGRVTAVGASVKGINKGDRIFTHGRHCAQDLSSNVIVPVPAGVSSEQAALARIAQVSITALRISEARLGDWVVVMGLGAVGNFAAQLFTLSGCEVIAVDVSEGRCVHARNCGVAHVIKADAGLKEQISQLTGGKMARTVVDATGSAAVVETAITLAGALGELILLGSPRGAYQTDLTKFLNGSHLWGNGCVTIKGAHEWRLPVSKDANGHQRHSMEGNLQVILRLMEQRRLRLEPLLERIVSPSEAPAVYQGLKSNKDDYLTAVIDWTRI